MTTPIPGQPFDSEEEKLLQEMTEHWRKVWNETPVQTIARVEDAAKQIIVVTTGLQGLYLAIFAFSTIRNQVMVTPGGWLGMLILLFFFTPLVCWLVSLFSATRVFVPRIDPAINLNELSVSAWQKIKQEYGRVSEAKLHWLHRSHEWLITSFILVMIAVLFLLFLPGVPVVGPTPIITVTPTPAIVPTPTH
jgi:hypothetical protein